MNRDFRYNRGSWIVAVALALIAVSAYAVDVVVRPGTGDALSVRSQTDAELFRVAESGEIVLPQPPPTVPGSEPLCRAGTGEMVRCGGNGYQVLEQTVQMTLQSGAAVEPSIDCPGGTRVVSGGYWLQSAPPENLLVHRNQPNANGTGWLIRVTNITAAPDTLVVVLTATCANL